MTQWKLTEAVFFAEIASKRPEYVNQYVQWLEEERLVIVFIDQGKSVEPPLLLRVIMDFFDCVTV